MTLKELNEHVLPPLDDELARAASEFDTLDELRGDIEEGSASSSRTRSRREFRAGGGRRARRGVEGRAGRAVVEARDTELLNGLVRSLERRGIDAGATSSSTGQTPQQLQQRLRDEARQSVARELVLEAVADKLGLEVSDDEIREQLREQGEADDDIDEFIAAGGADRCARSAHEKAVDRIAPTSRSTGARRGARGDRTPASSRRRRRKLWTPEQDKRPRRPRYEDCCDPAGAPAKEPANEPD